MNKKDVELQVLGMAVGGAYTARARFPFFLKCLCTCKNDNYLTPGAYSLVAS